MVIVDLLWTNQACNCQVSTSFFLEIREWTSFLCQLLQGPQKLNKQHRFWNKNGNDIMREDVVAILTDIKRILDSTGTNRLWILQECIISSIIALRQLLLSYQGSTISESRNCGRYGLYCIYRFLLTFGISVDNLFYFSRNAFWMVWQCFTFVSCNSTLCNIYMELSCG